MITDQWHKLPSKPGMYYTEAITWKYFWDNQNTVYTLIKLPQNTELKIHALNLDAKEWKLVSLLDSGAWKIENFFVPTPEKQEEHVLNDNVELFILQGLIRNAKVNWVHSYGLAHFCKATMDIMTEFEKLPFSEMGPYFRKNAKELIEAFEDCMKHHSELINNIVFYLIKEDPTLWDIIPNHLRVHLKVIQLEDGSPYIMQSSVTFNSFQRFRKAAPRVGESSSPKPSAPPIYSLTDDEPKKPSTTSSTTTTTTTTTTRANEEAERRQCIVDQISKSKINIPDGFLCPITRNIMFDPVMTDDGNANP